MNDDSIRELCVKEVAHRKRIPVIVAEQQVYSVAVFIKQRTSGESFKWVYNSITKKVE